MTTETTLTREDTGSFAAVRPVDPAPPVSAPYSRAVGILDKWARDARRTADEFSAWIEGQAAQAAAEMRALCDELELPPVQPTSVQWAELPEDDGELSEEDISLVIHRARQDPVAVYMDADDSDDMPGRRARLTPRDNPLAQAYAEREARGWTPDPADYGPHPVEAEPESWWRRTLGVLGQWVRL